MLALIEGSSFVETVSEGGWVNLPDGSQISPAHDGWDNGKYRLATITDAESGPTPGGKRIEGVSVKMIGGVPKHVRILVDLTAAELMAYAAQKRFAVETGGISVDGVGVRTDRESQAMLSGAYLAVQSNPDRTINWKTDSGFVYLDATAMTKIAESVLCHVQSCFDIEAHTAAAINAGTITTFEQIDAAAWPDVIVK